MVTVKITVEGLAEMVMGLIKTCQAADNSATAQVTRAAKAAKAAPPPAVPVSTALDDEDDSDEGMPGDNGEDDTVPVRKPRGRPAGAKGKEKAPAAKQPAASVATRDEIKALVRSRLREAKDQGPDEVARLNKQFAKLWKAYTDTGIFGDIPEDSDWELIYDSVNEA